jgi:rRNA maturation RNase YbeY
MLTVHGVLHLLGHDHATTSEATAMWQAQRAILNRWDDPDTSQRIYADGPT